MDKSFGNRLRELRRRKHLTQDEMAQQLNEQYGTKADRFVISKWESGKQEPKIATISILAKFFGTTIDYINSGVIPESERNPYEYVLDTVEREIIETYRKADGRQKMRIGAVVTEIADEIEKNAPRENGNGKVG